MLSSAWRSKESHDSYTHNLYYSLLSRCMYIKSSKESNMVSKIVKLKEQEIWNQS